MKAAVYSRYGPPSVVALAEVPTPTPGAREVLIRIVATTVTTADWRARSLSLPPGFGLLGRLVFGVFGPRKPILGTELAGTIEAVGEAVTRFKRGDQVFAFAGARYGCHAEYRTFAEEGLIALKPANLSFGEAAALSFGGTAEVTGVCSTANVELVRSIGADSVVDYTKEDFAKDGATYDIILDTTGTTSLSRCEGSLRQGGRLLLVLASFAQTLGLERPSKASAKKVVAGVAKVLPEDLRLLARLAEAGELKPVVDRSYPLESVAQAHAYVDTGRKRGNVVVTVG